MRPGLSAAGVVALFEGPGAAGTLAGVVLGAAAEPEGYRDTQAQCRGWWRGDALQVHCEYEGAPIAFCGHGLLASGFLWRCGGGELPVTLEGAVGQCRVTLEGGRLWLNVPRLSWRESERPSGCWFDEQPVAAATVGGEDGYWILRWPEGTDLRRLQPDFDAMCRDTRRAIIATAAAGPEADTDVILRYFAPQYGNPEDAVTGSACAILASYWPGDVLTLRQCSARGGLVTTRKQADTVALTGSIRLLSDTE